MNMRKMKWLFVVCATLILWGCSKEDTSKVEEESIQIKIGVLISLSGSGGSTGESTKAALQFFNQHPSMLKQLLKEINVNQHVEVTLVFEDTETNPEKALEAVKKLRSQGVRLFIGPYSTSELEFILQEIEENDMIAISASSIGNSLSVKKNNVFRLVPDNSVQVEAIHALMTHLDREKLIGMYRNDAWGLDLAQRTMKDKMDGDFNDHAIGYQTNGEDLISKTNELIQFINAKKSAQQMENYAVFLAGFSELSDILLNLSLKESEFNADNADLKFIGSSAFTLNNSILSSAKAADFAIKYQFLSPVFAPDQASVSQWSPIQDAVFQQLGRTPESYALVACDALQILVKAYLTANGHSNISEVRSEIIKHCKTPGLTGNLELNDFNDRKTGSYDFWGLDKSNSQYLWSNKYYYHSISGEIIPR